LLCKIMIKKLINVINNTTMAVKVTKG